MEEIDTAMNLSSFLESSWCKIKVHTNGLSIKRERGGKNQVSIPYDSKDIPGSFLGRISKAGFIFDYDCKNWAVLTTVTTDLL